MTLATSVRPIVGEISPQELFLLARRAADIPAEWPFTVTPEGDIMHHPGCPDAVCRVDYWNRHEIAGSVQFDTPYGFRGPNGESCDQLHATLVNNLLDLLDKRGVVAEWQNEYTGEWFTDRPVGTINK